MHFIKVYLLITQKLFHGMYHKDRLYYLCCYLMLLTIAAFLLR